MAHIEFLINKLANAVFVIPRNDLLATLTWQSLLLLPLTTTRSLEGFYNVTFDGLPIVSSFFEGDYLATFFAKITPQSALPPYLSWPARELLR